MSRPSKKKQLSAGVLPVARSTGRVLVGLRSQFCWEPWTWAPFGGSMDPEDETLYDTALRELVEETGYRGPITLMLGENVKYGGVEGHIFYGVVSREFTPRLNWEHIEARWVYPDSLDPEALHWSLAQLFGTK